MTVAELSERMGAGELARWVEYYRLEPFGQDRDNWHFGLLASMYTNSKLKKGSKKVTPGDFFYKPAEEIAKNKITAMMAGMDSLAAKTKAKNNG